MQCKSTPFSFAKITHTHAVHWSQIRSHCKLHQIAKSIVTIETHKKLWHKSYRYHTFLMLISVFSFRLILFEVREKKNQRNLFFCLFSGLGNVFSAISFCVYNRTIWFPFSLRCWWIASYTFTSALYRIHILNRIFGKVNRWLMCVYRDAQVNKFHYCKLLLKDSRRLVKWKRTEK